MTEPFGLSGIPALSRAAVERQEALRWDVDRLRSRWVKAKVLVVDTEGRTPIPFAEAGGADPARLAVRDATEFGDAPPAGAVFLGRSGDGDYWAVLDADVVEGDTVRAPGRFGVAVDNRVANGEMWVGLREHGDRLDDAGAGLFTTALALRNWHRKARYCARCGKGTELAQFGWVSRCAACEREEYPRTDPAVICLVHDDVGVNGEHVLLARQPTWPKDAHSVLAGFVEAGESLEACAMREIREEVGIRVREVRYLGSQPWPFPRSIMIGFTARADAGQPLLLADGEIEAARWVSRDEVLATFASEDHPRDAGSLLLPGNSSIARVMLQ
ncbi:MAG: NAD(+) diphosphatase, partial [Pseudonocardiaceae bacterium]